MEISSGNHDLLCTCVFFRGATKGENVKAKLYKALLF